MGAQLLTEADGIDDGRCRVCPSCGQYMFRRYPLADALVCGFCYGIGPDGQPTGRPYFSARRIDT